jgi:hypothetical protein
MPDWDANYLAREIAVAAMENEFPAILAAVAAERSIAAPPPVMVFRIRDDVRRRRVWPNIEVKPPEVTSVEDSGSRSVKSVVSVWVIGTISGAEAEALDDAAQAYHTAIGRTFLGREGSVGAATFSTTIRESSTSPPGKIGTSPLLQSAGARVEVTIVEDR